MLSQGGMERAVVVVMTISWPIVSAGLLPCTCPFLCGYCIHFPSYKFGKLKFIINDRELTKQEWNKGTLESGRGKLVRRFWQVHIWEVQNNGSYYELQLLLTIDVINVSYCSYWYRQIDVSSWNSLSKTISSDRLNLTARLHTILHLIAYTRCCHKWSL